MANALFDAARNAFLKSDLDWDDSWKVMGVDHADDTPNVSTDDFLDDILAGARVFTSAALANKTATAGVADADDITIASVTGDPFESLVLFNDTPGTEATKNLGVFIDTATGLPLTPNGGNVTITWDSGANKIYKL